MRMPRPLNFSPNPISIHHSPSQSHFGTHPSMIPEKTHSLFSNTYGNPFCNPLCFQTYAGMGGWGSAANLRIPRRMRTLSDHQESKGSSPGSRHFSPGFAFSLSLLEATLTKMPISVDYKGLTRKLNPLDATLTKYTGVWIVTSLASLSLYVITPFVRATKGG
jgi:hypothetical protein